MTDQRPHGEHPHLGECDCDECQAWDAKERAERRAADCEDRRLRYVHGTMVFWDALPRDRKPYWIVEWQSHNGPGCYWMVDAEGNSATAAEEELSTHPI